MKRIILPAMFATVTLISGCADSSALIRKSSTSVRSDVFQELNDGAPIPQGYTDLRITSSLKTHKTGIYSKKDIHGTPKYRLLINIDGQTVHLQGSLHEENIEPRGLRDPEAGEGIRYRIGRDLRLKAGAHRIVFAIPDDGLAVEREIALEEGRSNSLVLEPLYSLTAGKQRPGFYGITSFREGLKGFRVILNGKPI